MEIQMQEMDAMIVKQSLIGIVLEIKDSYLNAKDSTVVEMDFMNHKILKNVMMEIFKMGMDVIQIVGLKMDTIVMYFLITLLIVLWIQPHPNSNS